LRARYDAAQTTAENARHWAMADALSADSAASADVRKKLRERARYEVANNSYAKGHRADHRQRLHRHRPAAATAHRQPGAEPRCGGGVRGLGPAVNLAEKLRTMRMAKARTARHSPY
jgi:hypothetical protein